MQWHWAPIVSGPRAAKPTLDQPELSLAGNVEDASDSLDDMLADHPFGFDVVADVTPDAAFPSLPFNGPLLTPRAIHPEVEMRLFPRAALANADAEWSWTDLSTSASNQLGQSIDIRLALIQKLKESGVPNPESLPALQPENHPRIDAYPALSPRAGADADSPTGIVSDANDQPFPFYGRVRAAWK